ncbi:MAG: SGNH/GDSL hydrolase family protein [bacterium]|nr:SGNH/GDSL hydrolase family protein [bacterium]
MRRYAKPLLLVTFYIVYAIIYAGWLVYGPHIPPVFEYSQAYSFFLIVMASGFFLPLILLLYARYVGWKGLGFSLLPLGVVYVAFAMYYYYTQHHSFDPFLQSPPPRIGEHPRAGGGDTFRILALGGSTTRGIKLPAEKRYPRVLQALLQKRYPSVPIEVFNAGKDWYTTKHSLISYVTYYTHWRPDVVIVMHGINDLTRSFSPPYFAVGPYNEQWTHFYGPAIYGARPPTFEQHLLNILFLPMIDGWYYQLRARAVDYPQERYRSHAMFEKNLRKLIASIRQDRSEVLVLTQPFLYKETMSEEELGALWFDKVFCATRRSFLHEEYPSAASLHRAMKTFNQTTREVARSAGAHIIDAAARIEKSLDYFLDDVHYTEHGADVLANLVADAVIKAGLIEQRWRPEHHAEGSGPRAGERQPFIVDAAR